MRTAYVYVADDDERMRRYRKHAQESLIRFVPSAHVFTLTCGEHAIPVGERLPFENILDVGELFDRVFGPGEINKRVGGHHGVGFDYPCITYARLLPPLVPDLAGFDRFVYMDCDTEVVSTSFVFVESFSLGKNLICGAREQYEYNAPRFVSMIRERCGVDIRKEDYRNSGVLVMGRSSDPCRWEKKCHDALALERKYGFEVPDQDTINIVFRPGEMADAFGYLCTKPQDAPCGVSLLHFAGACKHVWLDHVAVG